MTVCTFGTAPACTEREAAEPAATMTGAASRGSDIFSGFGIWSAPEMLPAFLAALPPARFAPFAAIRLVFDAARFAFALFTMTSSPAAGESGALPRPKDATNGCRKD